MLTLIKKELRSLFFKPLFIGVITILNIVPTVLLIAYLKINQSQSAYAGFENMISAMAIVFAFAIPTVTILSVYREKGKETEELLLSMPISKFAIVASRFISVVIYFAIPTAIIAVLPIVFAQFGIVNFIQCYMALLMLVAFELFVIAFSFMLASKMRGMLSAIVVAYLSLSVSFVLGILSALVRLMPFGTQFDKVFGGILTGLSVFKKIDTVAYELFDWTAFAFFIIGAVVFTVISFVKIKKSVLTATVCALLIACIAILPIALPYSVRQIDISANKLYTPSVSAKNCLSSVNEEITVYLIDPYTNEGELYNAIVRTVETFKNVKLEIVNSAEDKDILEKYGLQDESAESLSYAMIVQGEKRWSFLNGEEYFSYYNTSMGYLTASEFQYRYTYCASLINQYYNSYESLSAEVQEALQKCAKILQSLQNETLVCLRLDDALSEAVAYVTADIIPTVYFLTGHGEEGTTANPYDFKANSKLPENADMAVINSPSEDYSESEIKALTDYVDNGGKLYILADVENYSMPNFASLLAYYGLSVEASAISVNESTVIPVSVNKSHEAFKEMSAPEVTLKDVSKINIADDTKYTYSTMLSYKHTEGEGESAKTVEYPVAVSVSNGNKNMITLFTGATTFNKADNGLTEEELERVSPCVSNVMSWMFEAFEPDISSTPPKLYQKTLYVADNGEITKTSVIFFAVALVVTVCLSMCVLSRSLRSKRAQNDSRDD